MKNPRTVVANVYGKWKFVTLPLDLEFEHFEFMFYNWWWNEEMQLLIDPFTIIRKTGKDEFLKLVQANSKVLLLGGQVNSVTSDTFKNWYAAQT